MEDDQGGVYNPTTLYFDVIDMLPLGPSWLNTKTGRVIQVADSHASAVSDSPRRFGLLSSQVGISHSDTEIHRLAFANGWLRVIRYRNGDTSFEGFFSQDAVDAIVEIAAKLGPEQHIEVEWSRVQGNNPDPYTLVLTAGEIVANSSLLESRKSSTSFSSLIEFARLPPYKRGHYWVRSDGDNEVIPVNTHYVAVYADPQEFGIVPDEAFKALYRSNNTQAINNLAIRNGWIRFVDDYDHLSFECLKTEAAKSTITELCLGAYKRLGKDLGKAGAEDRSRQATVVISWLGEGSESGTLGDYVFGVTESSEFGRLAFGEADLSSGNWNSRFLYDPKMANLLVTGNTLTAEEWFAFSGSNRGFDDLVRGWVGRGGKYRFGVIHFAPPDTRGAGYGALEEFVNQYGATAETVVRSYGGIFEQPLGNILGSLGESVRGSLLEATSQLALWKATQKESFAGLLEMAPTRGSGYW